MNPTENPADPVRTGAMGYAVVVRCGYRLTPHDSGLLKRVPGTGVWVCQDKDCPQCFTEAKVLAAQALFDAALAPHGEPATVRHDDDCRYCGHGAIEHKVCEPAPISTSRAAELWAARGYQHKLTGLTAAECRTLRCIWDRMPGHTSFADAFQRVRLHGSPAVLAALPAEPRRQP